MKIKTCLKVLPVLWAFMLTDPAIAGTVYENDISTQAKFNELLTIDNDAETAGNYNKQWKYYSWGPGAQLEMQSEVSGVRGSNDDYLIVPGLSLQSGHKYTLKYNVYGYGYQSTQTLDYLLTVSYGKKDAEEPTVSEISGYTQLEDGSISYGNKNNYESKSHEIAVDESGEYNISFHAYGAGLVLWNIVLEDAGTESTPMALSAEDVEALPTEGLSLIQKFNVTLPAQSVTGKALTAISKLEMTRDEEVATLLTEGLQPGAVVQISDNSLTESGVHSYSFKVYNGDESSDPYVISSIFVGPDTPLSPSNVSVTRKDGVNTVSWDAVSTGVHGKTLDAEAVRYTVVPVVDGIDGAAVTGLSTTTYSETFTPDGLQEISYKVSAVYYESISGATASSNSLQLGSMNLPFEDSFAGAKLGSGWTITSSYSGKQWTALSRTSSNPYATPYDSDGGLLGYNSYSIYNGYTSMAITPSLNLNSVKSPLLEFAFYHSSGSSSSADKIEVLISKDGGEYELIPGSEIKRYASTNEWKVYQFSLSDYKDSESVTVAFRATSGYGADMAIDAVRIYGVTSLDVSVDSLEGDLKVVAGNSANYSLRVKNSAFEPVSGESYTVEVYRGEELSMTLPGVDLSAGATHDFEFAMATDATDIEGGVPVRAELVMEGDEVPENNVSTTIETAVVGLDVAAITGLTGSTTTEGKLNLSWEAPQNDSFEASDVMYDFDDYPFTSEEYTADNSVSYPAEISGWKNIDVDGLNQGSLYGLDTAPKAFQYTSYEFMTNTNTKTELGDGAMLTARSPGREAGVASDYLISPAFPGSGTHVLHFRAKSGGSLYYGRFNIEYSAAEYSEDTPADSFIVLQEFNINGNEWTGYEVDLPSNAKYVAFHFVGECVGYNTGILFLDDVRLGSEPFANPTYNVYKKETGIALVAENLSATEYEMDKPSSDATFYVTSVYTQGESALSAPYSYLAEANPTAVEEVSARAPRINVSGRRIMLSDSTSGMNIYTMTGVCLARGVTVFTVSTPGIYVIRTSAGTTRLSIR